MTIQQPSGCQSVTWYMYMIMNIQNLRHPSFSKHGVDLHAVTSCVLLLHSPVDLRVPAGNNDYVLGNIEICKSASSRLHRVIRNS